MDPYGPALFPEESISYQKQQTPFGEIEVATLFGDPSKSGPYVQRLKFPADFEVSPHSHGDRMKIVTLLEGELLFGYLNETPVKMLPGSIWTESKDQVHFGTVGNKTTVIEIHGIGPVSSTPYTP